MQKTSASITSSDLEPNKRLQILYQYGNSVEIDPGVPPRRYFRSGLEMLRMANSYYEEGSLENAFTLYMKFIVLFVEKIRKHPEITTVPENERAINTQKLREVMTRAESLKLLLLRQFTQEHEMHLLEERENKRALEKTEPVVDPKLDEKSKETPPHKARPMCNDEQKCLNKLCEDIECLSIKDAGSTLLVVYPKLDIEDSQNESNARALNPGNVDLTMPSSVAASSGYSGCEATLQTVVYRYFDDYKMDPHQKIPDRALKPIAFSSNNHVSPVVDRSTKPSLMSPPVPAHARATLRQVLFPGALLRQFTDCSMHNTSKNIETCGILAGKLYQDNLKITHVLLPKQQGTANSCITENEEELFSFQDKEDLITFGWIHTHPSQTAFLSSVDLHTHCGYQRLLPEAIAVVISPKFQEVGIFMLTPDGLEIIADCKAEGFHPHEESPSLFSLLPNEKKFNSCHDKEFDPSAEMMVNDFDDERTLDEEEALEGSEDTQAELSNLQKERDMPLEELLALYGIAEGTESSGSSQGEEESTEILDQEQEDTEMGSDVEEQPGHKTIHRSELHQLYEDELTITVSQGVPRSQGSDGEEGEEEEEEDYDYSPDEDDEWKKTIMVGPDFQAGIPEGLCRYDDALPYENEDKLLWEPSPLTDAQAEDYLVKAQEPLAAAHGVHAIPTGSHIKDDEQALYLLLQCGYNIEEALRRRRMNVVAPTDTMSLWSEEECRNFENGLRIYGKDFHLIQQNKVRTRSVGELVQFYYLWKKTERHDSFANKARLEKKKYTLHPGITDYMDRLLDDQESVGPPRDRSLSPMTHCLIYGDYKRQQRYEYGGISESSGGNHTLLSTLSYSNNDPIMRDFAKQFQKESLDDFLKMATSALPHSSARLLASENSIEQKVSSSDINLGKSHSHGHAPNHLHKPNSESLVQ